MKKTELTRCLGSLSSMTVPATIGLLLTGCGADLLVGDEKGLQENRAELLTVPPWTPPSEYEASGVCAESDERARFEYERWRRTTNDFGLLVGTNWHGSSPSGKVVRLFIEPDTTAQVVFGDVSALPAIEADKGYLCGPNPDFALGGEEADCIVNSDGASFELHGARFEEGLLLAPIYGNAPWQEWCALQTPFEMGAGTCEFSPWEEFGFEIDPSNRNICHLFADNSQETKVQVDCSWLVMIAQQMTYCSCSSDGCFAQAKSPRDRLLELTLSEDGERLSGTLYNQFGDGQPLILERVP